MNIGLVITIIGMLVVFGFLAIIVVQTQIMSGIVLKFFPEKEEVAPVQRAQSNDAEIAIAIAAVKSYTGS